MVFNVKRDTDVAKALQAYDSSVYPVRDGLPESNHCYSKEQGKPIKKIDSFRSLLEEHAFALKSLSNLRQIIPFIRNREIEILKWYIEKRPVPIIFATTHVCETMV